jgi:hypothetical protein
MRDIYFYIPDKELYERMIRSDINWEDIAKIRGYLNKSLGRNCGNFTSWIMTTYVQLKHRDDLVCKLIDFIPKEGIVIADRDSLGNDNIYLDKTMLICAKGDREYHPSAYIHIVQNICDAERKDNSIWKPYYINHWSQPSIYRRIIERGHLVENIAYVGNKSNLAEDLKSKQWEKELNSIGCQWHPIFDMNRWNDYSYIDVIIACRRFQGNNLFFEKPASKLINSWSAGVPAIVGSEAAFLALKKSELDFLQATSLSEALDAVKLLKKTPELYLSMIQNGLERYQEFTDQKTTERWVSFFLDYVFDEYDKFLSMSEFQKKSSFVKRLIKLKLDRLGARVKKIALPQQ